MARANHLNNEIYIHDLSAYAVGMHNCLGIPFDDLLAHGFNTRQTDVRPARSVNTAFQLMAVIFQLQSLQQFGGTSATHIDWTMVPYVRMSFWKHFKDGLEWFEEGNAEHYFTNVDTRKMPIEPYDNLTIDKETIALVHTEQYTKAYNDNILSFVNNINTIEGGTHLEGFKRSLTKVFNLGHPITDVRNNKYLFLAKEYKLPNYRIITSGDLLVRGKGMGIPKFITSSVTYQGEALMIANIIDGVVTSIVFRSLGPKKEFLKWGHTKALFYGLGDLSEDFTYGTPIVLVEGHADRDMMKQIYPNTLAIMTSALSTNQVDVLKSLTDKVILMLDNDSAGWNGYYKAKKQLKDINVRLLRHAGNLTDAGQLADMKMNNDPDFQYYASSYKLQIQNLF